MTNTVLIKRSGVANAVPTSGDLVSGELAINYVDGNLFYKNSSNTVTVIASNKFVSASGNITGGNLLTGGLISASGNITGGNLLTGGIVSGLELSSTQSSGDEGGQINLALAAANTTLSGNVVIDVYQNRLRFFEGGGTNRGAYIDLTAAAAGVGTNLLAGGGGTPGGANTYVQFNDGGTFGGNAQFTYDKVTNIVSVGSITTTSNGLGTNILLGDDAYIGDINAVDTMGLKGAQSNGANAYIVFGNADGIALGRAGTGPLTYGGAFSASGNITGGNVLTGGLISSTGNVTGGNLLTGGLISATANITGGNILFGSGVVSGTGNITGGNILFGSGVVSGTGNITGGNISGTHLGNGRALTGIIKWTAQANTAPSSPTDGDFWWNTYTGIKYQYTNDGTTSTWIDQSPPTTFATITVGNIVNSNANGVGNIGAAGGYFNTVFAKATSAQYADLAEAYSADAVYPPGTVLSFGGDVEVTLTTGQNCNRIAGVVSTNPAHVMNSAIAADHIAIVALTGRVPTSVVGQVRKGDMMVSAGNGAAMASSAPAIGTVIGKALENFDGDSGVIEIVVGRL